MSHNPRPLIVTAIALLELLGAAVMVVGAIASLLGFTVIDDVHTGAYAAGYCLVLALICLVLFAGFWKGWNAWWYLGLLFTGIGILTGLFEVFTGGIFAIPGLLLSVLVLFYLLKPNVKRYFLE